MLLMLITRPQPRSAMPSMNCLVTVNTPVRFDGNHRIPHVLRHLLERPVAVDARVVDQDIDAAELLVDLGGQLDDFLRIADVVGEVFGLAAQIADPVLHVFGKLAAGKARQPDVGAPRGQGQGDGLANSPRPARDDRGLSFEAKVRNGKSAVPLLSVASVAMVHSSSERTSVCIMTLTAAANRRRGPSNARVDGPLTNRTLRRHPSVFPWSRVAVPSAPAGPESLPRYCAASRTAR